MEDPKTNSRRISFWQLFIFMGIMGVFIGLFSLAASYKHPNPDIGPITAFLIGYIPCQLGALLFWLAAKRAGHKNGIPIR